MNKLISLPLGAIIFFANPTPLESNTITMPETAIEINSCEINQQEEITIEEEDVYIAPVVVEEQPKRATIMWYDVTTDVTQPCGLTREQLSRGLKGNLKNYAQDFLDAEDTYGVNAIFLASIAAWESGWGSSNAAVNKNNFFGYGPGIYFSSPREGIKTVANSLSKNYLSPNGKYYKGATFKGVGSTYCADGSYWAGDVCNIANTIIKNAIG